MASDAGAGEHAGAFAGPGGGLLEFDLGQFHFLSHQGGHVPGDLTEEVTQGSRFSLCLRGCGRHFAAHRRPPSKGSSRRRISLLQVAHRPWALRPGGPARRRGADRWCPTRSPADSAGRCPRGPPSWFAEPASAPAAAEPLPRYRGSGQQSDVPVAVAPVVSGAPALRLRLRRPASTPAPAASRRKVPGRWRAKDFTSVSSEPGSRPSSQDATAEDRSAAWRTRSVATPGWSEAAAMECSSPATDSQTFGDLLLLGSCLLGEIGLGLVQQVPGIGLDLGGNVDCLRLGRLGDVLGSVCRVPLYVRSFVLGRFLFGVSASRALRGHNSNAGVPVRGSFGCCLGPWVLCHRCSLSGMVRLGS